MKENQKKYTSFVSEVFQCVMKILPDKHSPLVAFANDIPLKRSWCIQDTAYLTEGCASFFIDIIHKNKELFGIDVEKYQLIDAKLRPGEKNYKHSCYPKNVRRWLQGTLSRKKEARVQFCTFLYCWAIGWGDLGENHFECQKELKKICRSYLPDLSEDMELLPMLWNALEASYRAKERICP